MSIGNVDVVVWVLAAIALAVIARHFRPGWAQRAIERHERKKQRQAELERRHEAHLRQPCRYCFSTLSAHDAGCPDDPESSPTAMLSWDQGWRAARMGVSNLKPENQPYSLGFQKGLAQRELAEVS